MEEMVFHVPTLAWARSAVEEVQAAGYVACLACSPNPDGSWTLTIHARTGQANPESPIGPAQAPQAFEWATFVNGTVALG